MKEKVYVTLLLFLEIAFFIIVNILFKLPSNIIIRTGFIWFFLSMVFQHYKLQSILIWDELENLFKALISYFVVVIITYYPQIIDILKVILIGCFMVVFDMILNRQLRIIFREKIARKTLIIGTSNDAYFIYKVAKKNRFSLTNVVAFARVNQFNVCDELKNDKEANVYSYDQIDEIFNTYKIDQIIIAIPNAPHDILNQVSRDLHGKAKYIKVMPRTNFTITFNSKINDYDGVLLISTSRGIMNTIDLFVKRIIDICAGIAGCVLLIPLTIFVIYKNRKNGDTDPIIFTQERIGKDGKPIKIYKYRSMVPNAEAILEELMEKDPAIREEYLTNKKLVNDPRITEAGNFLRRTSLDEFPQFINVLKGEMSLVGPRPYLPREKEDMDIYYDSIIKCKPGITGMWQANGRSDVGFEDRLKLDDFYYRNYSFKLDMVLVYKTIRGVLYGKGAM